MEVLSIITLILNIILFIYGLYFVIFGIFPLILKKKEEKKFKPKHRFRIVVAARNEENVIADLIDSLKTQDYPSDMYDIYIACNNCTDKTKEVSLKAGAKVIEVKNVKTKGEVLNYLFEKWIDDDSFDCYAIFDADNVVDKNFLKEMNNKLENGYEVAEGFRDTKNLYDTWLSGSYAISYYLQHLFLYETREKINASANLNGTGYVILKDTIKKMNFKTTTLTEDIELTAVCAINNVKIGFANKAIFYDEQVDKFIPSIKQRKRWNLGTLQVLKRYLKDLGKGFLKNHNLHAIDSFILAFGPIYQILVAIVTIINVVVAILTKNIVIMLAYGLLSYLGTVFLSWFLCFYNKKKVSKLLPAIFLFSLFMVSGIISAVLALVNPKIHWEVVKHNSKGSIDDVIKNN